MTTTLPQGVTSGQQDQRYRSDLPKTVAEVNKLRDKLLERKQNLEQALFNLKVDKEEYHPEAYRKKCNDIIHKKRLIDNQLSAMKPLRFELRTRSLKEEIYKDKSLKMHLLSELDKIQEMVFRLKDKIDLIPYEDLEPK